MAYGVTHYSEKGSRIHCHREDRRYWYFFLSVAEVGSGELRQTSSIINSVVWLFLSAVAFFYAEN